MLKAVYAVAGAAALAACSLIAIPALVNASAPAPGQKTDLADLTDCELRSWPYYARACVRDETRNAGGRAIKVRIVAPDRIPAWELKAASGLQRAYPAAEKPDVVANPNPADMAPVAPSGWVMPYSEVRLRLDAGDFIRRTVR
jgi:hypothetical protein